MIEQGDCLEVMAGMEEGSVDLIYADPPFNSGRDWEHEEGAFTDIWESMDEYLSYMRARLESCRRVLARRGSIYLHCDDSASHRLRCVMDDVFGTAAYSATITWKRSKSQSSVSRKWGRMTDVILHYAHRDATFNPVWLPYTDDYIRDHFYREDERGKFSPRYPLAARHGASGHHYEWKGYRVPKAGWSVPLEEMRRLEADDRLWEPVGADGKPDLQSTIYMKKHLADSRGIQVGNLWTDIHRLSGPHTENADYPTQKPLALLERIVGASSEEGDLVFDPFMGSGTTLVAAKRMGRRYTGCDISADAVAVAKKRLDGEEETLL